MPACCCWTRRDRCPRSATSDSHHPGWSAGLSGDIAAPGHPRQRCTHPRRLQQQHHPRQRRLRPRRTPRCNQRRRRPTPRQRPPGPAESSAESTPTTVRRTRPYRIRSAFPFSGCGACGRQNRHDPAVRNEHHRVIAFPDEIPIAPVSVFTRAARSQSSARCDKLPPSRRPLRGPPMPQPRPSGFPRSRVGSKLSCSAWTCVPEPLSGAGPGAWLEGGATLLLDWSRVEPTAT